MLQRDRGEVCKGFSKEYVRGLRARCSFRFRG